MLRVDLFEIVDGLFKGIVYFFYNIFETIFNLIKSPLRGPMRLYRKHRRSNARQLGGPTFLFLSFFAFFAIHFTMRNRLFYDETAGETPVGEEVGAALTNAPTVDADWLWLVLAASLTATILVDSVLRLALSLRALGGRERRAMVLETVEYSIFWPILLMSLLSLRDNTLYPLENSLAGTADDLTPGLILLLLLCLLLLSLVPAAVLLSRGVRRWSGASQRWTSFARLTALAATTAVVALAATAGARMGYGIEQRRNDTRTRAVGRDLLVIELECQLDAPRPYVEAVIWNRGDAMVSRDVYYTLYVGENLNLLLSDQDLERARQYRLVFGRPAEPTILFEQGQVRRLRLLVQDYRGAPTAFGQTCGLKVERPLFRSAAELEASHLRGPVELLGGSLQ